MYYELENFYGSHRNYVKSRSYYQLRGITGKSISDCSPIKENEDISTTLKNLNNVLLDKDADANPCGLIAKYLFTDTYTLAKSGTPVSIDDSKISHSVDRNSRFKRPSNYKDIQWHDTEDEHLMVWFQTDVFSNFIKLYGKVGTDLEAGTQYSLTIDNKFTISGADIKKYVYFSEANAFGGNNIVFGVIYLAGSGVFFLLALVMICLEVRHNIKKNKIANR